MTRIIQGTVATNIQDHLPQSTLVAEKGYNSLITSKGQYNRHDGSLDLMLTNRETHSLEPGKIFRPKLSDVDRIYSFMNTSLSKDKALEYTPEEIYQILKMDANVVNCVENPNKDIIGITISYPSVLMPEVANREGWYQEGGFNPKFFNHNATYNELRAVNSAYRESGLGKILLSKVVLDSANRNFNEVVLYSVSSAYQNHLNFGFNDLGRVKLSFKDDNVDTHLMNLLLNKNKLNDAKAVLDKHILR